MPHSFHQAPRAALRLFPILASVSSLASCAAPLPEARQPTSPPVAAATREAATREGATPDTATPDAPKKPLVPAADQAIATARREALLLTLRQLAAAPGFALGHEDTTAYGVGWQGDTDRSDVKDVCDDHVAVFGWDAFGIEKGAETNGDGVPFDLMRREIATAHARGGMNTVSWHLDNPVTGGNAWDASGAVAQVLPGAPHHASYLQALERLATFLSTLRGHDGELVPLVFRPFHEHTGGWFWWGRDTTEESDYQTLFRFTIDYLRHEKGLTNLLVAFSPGGGEVSSTAEYLYGYPGDDYVDVLGLDYYYIGDSQRLVDVSRIAVAEAKARGKVAAITEFGARGGLNQLGVDSEEWFGRHVLAPLTSNPDVLGIAYALAWRNARPDHCFVSYRGHVGEQDFRNFCRDPRVFLLADLPRLPESPGRPPPAKTAAQ